MISNLATIADRIHEFLAQNPQWHTANSIAAQLSRPTKAALIASTLDVLYEAKSVDRRQGVVINGVRQKQYRAQQRQTQSSVVNLNRGLLRGTRKSTGITLQEAADALGITLVRVKQIEVNDICRLRIEVLIRYCNAIGVCSRFTVNDREIAPTPGLLRQLRLEREMTQDQAAVLHGTKRRALSHYERQDPVKHTLVSLDTYLWQVFRLRLSATIDSRRIVLPEPPNA